MPLLSVSNFSAKANDKKLVNSISFEVHAGSITGIVGESGSGKSVTCMGLTRLLPKSLSIDGNVIYENSAGIENNLLACGNETLRLLRGKEISYIFQEPMTALNPTLSIGRQLVDVIRRHTEPDSSSARHRALKLLADVRIDSPEDVFNAWPHQLSGGMRQRVLIAMAFSCTPALIVADEPTTALDVTVQAQVLTLLLTLARERRTAVLLISHDIGVIRRACETVHVMYAGRIVERGSTTAVLAAPRHPYTRALLDCLPGRARPKSRLKTLSTSMQTMPGCCFRARCHLAFQQCSEVPPLADISSGDAAACWLTQQDQLKGELF